MSVEPVCPAAGSPGPAAASRGPASHASGTPVLSVRDLTIALPAGADRPNAVERVSFDIAAGETVCVVGESGSGKSVLAYSLIGLLPRELRVVGGSARLAVRLAEPLPTARAGRPPGRGSDFGVDLDLATLSQRDFRSLRGSGIGFVFQEPMTALNPVMRVGDQIEELLRAHARLSAGERRTRMLEMLARVRLPDPPAMLERHPHRLSGGQRQRIVIAMALLLRPVLLIADEPTTALDVTTQAEILSLVRELAREQGTATLFITHDMGVVSEIADRILVLNQGVQEEYGARDQVLQAPRADYTRMLLAAVPSLAPPAPRELARGPVRLEARALGMRYSERRWPRAAKQTVALQDFALALREGETVGIVGESGSGKTTAARCLLRLLEPTAGAIAWDGAEVTHASRARLRRARDAVQIVFQDPNRSLNPRWTAGKSIVEGALNLGVPRDEAWARARELMRRVRLPEASLARYPHQFSGGQRQRLAIARALAVRPRVLVADEAVSALDVSVQAQILALLRELRDELKLALLFITHDLRVAAQLCDRVMVMQAGQVVEEGLTAQVFGVPRHAYTRALLAAAPGRGAMGVGGLFDS